MIFICLRPIFEGEGTQGVCMQTNLNEKEKCFRVVAGKEKTREQSL